MSSRVLGGWGGIGRSVSKTLGFQNAAQTASFSRCANLGEERTGEAKKAELEVGASEKERRQGENSQEKGQQDHQGAKGGKQRAKRSGFALPAFALFAVGLPLGYYFSDYTPFGKRKEHSHPSEFVKYTLVDKENVSSTAAIFRLKPSSSTTVDLDDPSLERAITSVEFKQPQLQIARSYTCLPQEDGQPVDELRFLIRREQKGEVSNFLHRLPVGAEIDVRGLHTEYVIPEDVKSMAWLVGGTGIAPAMQAADILGENADVYILWASRRREDCIGGYNDNLPEKRRWSFWPGSGTAEEDRKIAGAEKGALVRQLENLKHRSATSQSRPRLTVDYHVDEEGALVKADEVRRMLQALARSDNENASGRNVLVVSGPEGFIAHWAGPKQWAGGREIQGPLRGVLSTLDLTGWDIVKL